MGISDFFFSSRRQPHASNMVNAWLYFGGLTPLFFRVWQKAALVAREVLPPGAAILDYGCGTGGLTRCMARQGFACTGVEWDAWLLNEAGTHLRQGSPEDDLVAELMLAEEIQLMLPDNHFALAVTFLGLHGKECNLQRAMLEELRRLAPLALLIDWQLPERNLHVPGAAFSRYLAQIVNYIGGNPQQGMRMKEYYRHGALEGILYTYRASLHVERRLTCMAGSLGMALVRWQ